MTLRITSHVASYVLALLFAASVTATMSVSLRITSDEAEKIVWELPEIKHLADRMRHDGSRPFTRIESVAESDSKPGATRSVYTVYFGEDRGTHTVREMTFLVDAFTRKISVYDVVNDNSMPIDEWRKTQKAFTVSDDKFVFVRKGNVWIAKTDGTEQKQLTFSGLDRNPVISPDWKMVAYASGNDKHTGFGNIYTVPSKGGPPQKLKLKGMSGSEHPYFSPGGDNLVFIGMSGITIEKKQGYDMTYATMSINIIELKTGRIKQIASVSNAVLDAGYIYSSPSFSGDGKLIAFQHSGSDVSGGFSIIDLKGKRLFHFPSQQSDYSPYWKPIFSSDGEDILCYSPAISESGTDAIYLANRKTGMKKKVAEGVYPAFVDGGRAIVFAKLVKIGNPERDVKSVLWYLELKEGAKPKKILDDASQPDGRILSYKEKYH